MTLQSNEDREPSSSASVPADRSKGQAVALARVRAAAAIDQLSGPDKELYQHNKSLAKAFWPELCDLQVAWVARVASDLQLDILLEEVIWLRDNRFRHPQVGSPPSDQGRPYVTIKGLLRLLNRHPQFDNYELEPASDELRRSMRVAREEEQVWVCRLWRKDRSRPAIGYGRATPEDTFVGYRLAERDEAPGKESPPSTSSEPALSLPKGQAGATSSPVPRPSASGVGQVCHTPAVAEVAQKRAVRRAAQGAFGWEFAPTLFEPASGEHKRVDPEKGHLSTVLDEGTPNVVGCTESQRRAIHSLAGAQELPEGKGGSGKRGGPGRGLAGRAIPALWGELHHPPDGKPGRWVHRLPV